MEQLNIYSTAKVTLTDKGADLLTRYYNGQPAEHACEKHDPKRRPYKGGEVYENSVMEIMNIFGKYLYKGCTPLFENDSLNF